MGEVSDTRHTGTPRSQASASSRSSKWTSMSNIFSLPHVVRRAPPEEQIRRIFKFLTRGQPREVAIAHANNSWYLILDSVVVNILRHRERYSELMSSSPFYSLDFVVDIGPDAEPLSATAFMAKSYGWTYVLSVNDIHIPASWA